MHKQMRLPSIDEWWGYVIAERKRDTYRQELEHIRNESQVDEMETFSWIKNPVTRVLVFKKDSNLKWVITEQVTKLIPQVTKDGPAYKFADWARTEVVEFPLYRKRNKDLLGIEAYDDMGLTHYEEPPFAMDKVHFNECCTRDGSHLLALYEKNHLDYKKDYWMDESWLTTTLKIEYKLAQALSLAFEKLKLNKTSVVKLINGHDGLKGLPRKLRLAKIDYYIELGSVMQQLKRNPVSSGETNGDVEGDADWIQEMDRQLQDAVPDETEYEDRFDLPKDTVFGTHRLHFGEEGCSHALLSFVKGADQKELNRVKAGMYPQKDPNGRKERPRFWYLTNSQKSQLWTSIKARQADIDYKSTYRF